MSRAVPSDLKNLETNLEPRSDVTCSRTPCLENTWIMNRQANSVEVTMSVVGMKIDCFEKQSTMTRIEVNPEEAGSCLMKSIEIEFQGFSGTGSCCSIL